MAEDQRIASIRASQESPHHQSKVSYKQNLHLSLNCFFIAEGRAGDNRSEQPLDNLPFVIFTRLL